MTENISKLSTEKCPADYMHLNECHLFQMYPKEVMSPGQVMK